MKKRRKKNRNVIFSNFQNYAEETIDKNVFIII